MLHIATLTQASRYAFFWPRGVERAWFERSELPQQETLGERGASHARWAWRASRKKHIGEHYYHPFVFSAIRAASSCAACFDGPSPSATSSFSR